MQTGQRGAARPHPGNVTGMTFHRQQREQDAQRKLAAESHDEADRARAAFRAGFDAGHEARWSDAIAWVREHFDVFDKDQGDEADEN